MRQRFQVAVGGALRLLPPQAQDFGAPTSAAVTLKSVRGLDLPTPVVDAAAVADAVDTTTAAAAAEGALRLELEDVAGVAPGRHYLVTAVDGERFLVEVAGVDQVAQAVLLIARLSRDLEAGAAVEGVELSYALAGAQCPDPLTAGSLYRAAWWYEIGGADYAGDQIYEVRRRILLPTLTADEVERNLPAPWSELSDEGPRALRRALEEAWDDVLDDLQKKGFEPDKVMDPDRLRQPHRDKTLAKLARGWGSDWKEFATLQATLYNDTLEAALSSGDWYDKVEDSQQGAGETQWPSITFAR